MIDLFFVLAGYFFCRSIEAFEADHPIAGGLLLLLSVVTAIVWFGHSTNNQ